jgi:Secretion system C-terminal sorting domain
MKTYTRFIAAAILLSFCFLNSYAQQSLKSLLINHGAPSCGSTAGEQQLFSGTVSGNPLMIQSCNNGLPFYSVFTAYNPKDKKIYFADIGSGNTTNMYALDYNLSGVINCPAATTPDYIYNYHIDQLCFDANGDNLAIYNYDAGTGLARIKRIDVATGIDLPGTDKALQFEAGHYPNSLSWGDIVFMPNGRVFMTFGNSPSRLFELIDFDATSPLSASAVFLADIPRPCFSIGYVDGNLIIAGSDGSGCYYYTWDINSNILSTENNFPAGKTTADMSHMNVGLGVAQEMQGSTIINSSTADIIYYIYLKNKGNIDLANVQLANNLTNAFGAGNISNAQISFVSNAAGLVLNPGYDGVNDTLLLQPGQAISNYPVTADSVIIELKFRAGNLIQNKFYYNSAIATGQIGAGANLLAVSDSSNNGNAGYTDLDNNGVSDDAGEGIPTPFVFSTLLAKNNLQFSAHASGKLAVLNWEQANENQLKNYELERSEDGIHFITIAKIMVGKDGHDKYSISDNPALEKSLYWYYRLKLNDSSGKYSYSNVKMISFSNKIVSINLYPNPVAAILTVQLEAAAPQTAGVILLDNAGRRLRQWAPSLVKGVNHIQLDQFASLTKGIYFLEVYYDQQKKTVKVIK